MKEKDIDSLKHTTWRYQYHIVFAPKYRRMVVYRQIKQDIGQILRRLCEQNGVEIIETQAGPDYIHMPVSIPLKIWCSINHGIFQRKKQPDDFRPTCQFEIQIWRPAFLGKRGYYVDTVGRNKKQIQEYIKHQLEEERIAD